MKFAYCATIQPKFGGLRSFNVGLAKALKIEVEKQGHELYLITQVESKNDYDYFENHLITFQGNHLVFENLKLPFLLKKLSIDFAIFPHNRLPIFSIGSHKNAVIFHDLLFWRFPHRFTFAKRWVRAFFLKYAANTCEFSFSVSAFTASELEQYIPGHKSLVCYQAINPIKFNQNDIDKIELPNKPYFLFIGAQSFQKNLLSLVQAFNICRANQLDCQLVIAGGKGSEEIEINRAINESEFSQDIIATGFIDEITKIALLKNCIAFVFPSIYEGFGIPLLEAFQLGVPVISSNASCLPEISASAAYEVDPNPEALSKAMLTLMNSPEKRQQFVSAGLEREKEFSWEMTAKIIVNRLLSSR